MNPLIDNLQKQFLQEAINSPILLSDLASMETYIAESYQDRSLIELLQNADDASAKRFKIKQTENVIFVANDGRHFSEEDVLSLCRSGSSTKRRGSNTIGYRGIGFKSVVNLANRVHVISNNLMMTFSRELTSKLLNNDISVPLIRIPHHYNPYFNNESVINEFLEDNFTTIFIFEQIKTSNLEQEIDNFDSSSLLFLRNVRQVEFDTNISKIISVKRIRQYNKDVLTITEDGKKENWLVYHSKLDNNNKIESLAFLLDEKFTILPLSPERAVVHSFMPTKDYVGVPMKINGDFSTDPSRTKVTFDDLTQGSLQNCINLVLEILQESLSNSNPVFEGIFRVLGDIESDSLSRFMNTTRFRDYFINEMRNKLNSEKWFPTKKGYVSLRELKVNPDWLNKTDFLRFCESMNFIPIDKSYESSYPGILKFAKNFGSEEFSVLSALQATEHMIPSTHGGVEILLACLKKYRFNFDKEINEIIKKAHIIKFESGFVQLINIKDSEKIDESYLKYLSQQINDFNDLIWFFKQLNVSIDLDKYTKKNDSNLNENKKLVTDVMQYESLQNNPKIVNFNSSLSRWRSAETNLAAFLESEQNVIKVTDVSKSNLGYDLEVHKDNNIIEYIEIKSVDSIGATISLTNNEYATASEYQEKYILAIVKQTAEGLEACFIRNPIESLKLTKRVTRWEWICDEYTGIVKNYKFS